MRLARLTTTTASGFTPSSPVGVRVRQVPSEQYSAAPQGRPSQVATHCWRMQVSNAPHAGLQPPSLSATHWLFALQT